MYQEYPKWLYPENSAPVLVQNAKEEAALSGTSKSDAEPAPAPAAEVQEANKRGRGRPRKVP
jgi:hypothetical protein